jgi:hypothetical protein
VLITECTFTAQRRTALATNNSDIHFPVSRKLRINNKIVYMLYGPRIFPPNNSGMGDAVLADLQGRIQLPAILDTSTRLNKAFKNALDMDASSL